MDRLAEEVNDKLQESGQVTIAELCKTYDLPKLSDTGIFFPYWYNLSFQIAKFGKGGKKLDLLLFCKHFWLFPSFDYVLK